MIRPTINADACMVEPNEGAVIVTPLRIIPISSGASALCGAESAAVGAPTR